MSDYTYIYQGIGTLHGVGDGEQPSKGPLRAILWVPDIDARHKWREHYVRGEVEKPNGKPDFGFRKGDQP
jgi:hypothetical protein